MNHPPKVRKNAYDCAAALPLIGRPHRGKGQTISYDCRYLSESLGANASSNAPIETLYGQKCDFRFVGHAPARRCKR
jgi:hypothetical protein